VLQIIELPYIVIIRDRPQSFNGSASEQMSNLPPSESKRHSICNGGDQKKCMHEKQDQLLNSYPAKWVPVSYTLAAYSQLAAPKRR